MKKNYYILVLSLLFVLARVKADPTITFFFKPFVDMDRISKKLRELGSLAHHKVHGIMKHTIEAGILVTYGGYITASSYNGEVIFPRRHHKSSLTIVVTPEMVPVSLFENTILHWDFIPGLPVKIYSCELEHDDKKGQYYWNVQEVSLPRDNRIPLAAIMIIADPKDIVINEGRTPTNETANLVLPDIYVKKGINIVENSSYMLTIRHLFKPVEIGEKSEPLKMLTHVID